MQLLRLRLVNFRQHADTELEFGPGITGIIGPNGSGKTSILEAIAWALYGVQAVRGDKDSRSEEHTSELQSRLHLVCRLLLEKKKNKFALVSDTKNFKARCL